MAESPLPNYPAPSTAYPVPTAPIGVEQRAFTASELSFIQDLMAVTPSSFLSGCNPGFDQKIRLLGITQLALQDINNYPPCTSYTLEGLPAGQRSLLIFGTQLYIMLMEQMRFSLIDISYSDGGLSINLDRVGKIGAAYDKMLAQWNMMLSNFKKCVLLQQGGVGLGTPRFQSNLSRFISMLGSGSAFGFNIP
jgi:hypothetical protein